MSESVRLDKAVCFYDDRSQELDLLRMHTVLWSDSRHALVEARGALEPLLFRLEDGTVLNEEFGSYYGTNDFGRLLEANRTRRDEVAAELDEDEAAGRTSEVARETMAEDRLRLASLNADIARHLGRVDGAPAC